MNNLTVETSLIPVDMGAKPEIQIIHLDFKNSTGIINILDFAVVPTTCLRYKFEIKCEQNKWFENILNLPSYTADFIFCTSCSLANPIALFSPLSWSYLPATIKEERSPNSQPRVYLAEKVGIKQAHLEIDETRVLNTMEKMLQHRTSNDAQRNLLEENITESISNYQLALMSPNILARFVFLFLAFEKAVNADKDRQNKDFDIEASRLTKLPDSEIEELRRFYDRIKHVFRNTNDILTMESGIKNFSELSLKLKSASDISVLSRIGAIGSTP